MKQRRSRFVACECLACLAVVALTMAPLAARAQSEESPPQAEITALASLPYEFLERFRKSELNSLYAIAYEAANPFYLSGDFDGDGEMDYALKIRAKSDKDVEEDVVFFAKGEPRLLSSDIKEDYPGPAWYVVSKKERPELKGDAIMMVRPESSAALVSWDGKRFQLSWEGG